MEHVSKFVIATPPVLKVPGSKQLAHKSFQKHSVHPAINGYLTLQSWEGEGGEEEKWHPTSVTPLPVQVGTRPLWPMERTFPFSCQVKEVHPLHDQLYGADHGAL